MQHLLTTETFDRFLFCEGELHTYSSFQMDGRINRNFFDSEELDSLTEDYILWGKIRNIFFDVIKGKKAPTKMKLILALPRERYSDFINQTATSLTASDLSGLFLHIHYEHSAIQLITGSSLKIFSMDKSLDHSWDTYITELIKKYFDFEIQ